MIQQLLNSLQQQQKSLSSQGTTNSIAITISIIIITINTSSLLKCVLFTFIEIYSIFFSRLLEWIL